MAPYLNDTEEEGADTEEDAWAIITQRMLGVGNRPGRKTIIMSLGHALIIIVHPKKSTLEP